VTDDIECRILKDVEDGLGGWVGGGGDKNTSGRAVSVLVEI
jgi:hypothetical protein